MEIPTEVPATQVVPAVVPLTEPIIPSAIPPVTPPVKTVTLTQEELDDLEFRASQSSQNFERLKESEARRKELETLLDPALSDPERNDGALAAQVAELTAKQTRSDIIEAYPVLKDVWTDFDSFRQSDANKGMSPMVAAKAFLIEKGLLEPSRAGLEMPTGGSRVPTSPGMSSDDIKKLRETDYKKYRDMVKKGLIKIS